MKREIIIILLVSIFFTALTFGQNIDSINSKSKLGIKAGYFGDFVLHPGFAVGIDYTIHEKSWFNLHSDSELGVYFHKWNNNALFIQSTIGSRFFSYFSSFVDINVGLGYMLTTPNGDVYVLDDNGELTLKGRPYQSALKPNVSLMFGWDGTRKKDIPLIIHAGIEGYWQSHFNHSMLPHAAFRIGIVYRLKKK